VCSVTDLDGFSSLVAPTLFCIPFRQTEPVTGSILFFIDDAFCGSVVKTPSELHVDLSGQIPVIAAKGEAVVENHTPVGQVERGHGQRETFAEILPS